MLNKFQERDGHTVGVRDGVVMGSGRGRTCQVGEEGVLDEIRSRRGVERVGFRCQSLWTLLHLGSEEL